MAPSFENLPEGDDYDSEEEIDFSDLRAQHEVRIEEGLDTFVVVDGLPVVETAKKGPLIKYLINKKLNTCGIVREENVFMPTDDSGKTEGYAFVEFQTPDQAAAAIKTLHATSFDKKHTMAVNRLADIDRYGREGRIDEEFVKPDIEPFQQKDHLRSWLGDPNSRDQFVMYRGDTVGVYWNRKKETPENVVDRSHWTEAFVQWTPLGTYLATIHRKGIQLWGGPNWVRQNRFPHPLCDLIDFSPNEKYVCTWSFRPIEVEEDDPVLSVEENNKNYIIWDAATGQPLRSFATHQPSGPATDDHGNPIKPRLPWPAFKWSSDDKYVARMLDGQSISVYELPSMKQIVKGGIKIDGVRDFEWAPALPQRDGIKAYEQLFCFWTPEIGSNPAKVGLMSIPSQEIVRTRNLFNVSDAKLHWQSQAAYVCVKVDRHSKSKKSLATNLEIFRVREKGVPVEVVDSIKDTVINFAWEPKGDRFVLITTAEVVTTAAVPPKTSVSFFCPEKVKGAGVGNFKHIRTIDKKNSNAIYWSPKGRFVVVATVASSQSSDLEFWDLDYEGEKSESDKDLTSNLQLMGNGDHYGITDIEWDPTGRYVASSASMFKQQIEHGYHIYDFKGELLREEQLEKFKQFYWRPRPATMLSKDEQKQVRRNLREYAKDFEEEDRLADDKEKGAVVEERRRLLSEWLSWRQEEQENLREERIEEGLSPDAEEEERLNMEKLGGQVIEEIVEEIVDEQEEIVG